MDGSRQGRDHSLTTLRLSVGSQCGTMWCLVPGFFGSLVRLKRSVSIRRRPGYPCVSNPLPDLFRLRDIGKLGSSSTDLSPCTHMCIFRLRLGSLDYTCPHLWNHTCTQTTVMTLRFVFTDFPTVHLPCLQTHTQGSSKFPIYSIMCISWTVLLQVFILKNNTLLYNVL